MERLTAKHINRPLPAGRDQIILRAKLKLLKNNKFAIQEFRSVKGSPNLGIVNDHTKSYMEDGWHFVGITRRGKHLSVTAKENDFPLRCRDIASDYDRNSVLKTKE